jgi:peptidoglycan/LPS O-acetylase OafA/YrhL
MNVRAVKVAPAGEIRSLTGLRGVSALYVMEYHITFLDYYQRKGMLATFLCHGYLAVSLFFILSGFVMALTSGGDFAKGFDVGAYGSFLAKRLGRTYPLYFVATAVCALIGVWHMSYQGTLTPGHVASNFALIQCWGIGDSIDPPGWSISTEFGAYVLFPALAAAFLFSRARLAAVGAVACVVALEFAATRSGAELHNPGIQPGPLAIWIGTTLYPLLICIAGFSLGLAVWRAWSVPAVHRLAADQRTGAALALACLALLCFHVSDVLTVVFIAGLILSLATEKPLLAWVLASPPIYWLGMISYSIYLVHWPILAALQGPLHTALDHGRGGIRAPSTIIITVAAITCATLAHYLIERPGRKLSRNLLSKYLGRRSGPAEQAALEVP